MNNYFSYWIDVLIHHHIIEEKQKGIYVYGLQVIAYKIVYACILLLCCLGLKRNLWELFLYYGCFMSIRKYSGGYHAKSIQACMILFALTYLYLDVFLVLHLKIVPLLNIILALFFVLGIYHLCPKDCANKRLSKDYKAKYKKLTGYILIIWLSIMILLFCFNYSRLALIILYCFCIIFIMLL